MNKGGMNGGFWKERKRLKREDGSQWLITKGKDGKRIFDPEMNKQNIAEYYEGLYGKRPAQHHTYHTEVAEAIKGLSESHECGQDDTERPPTRIEVKEAIMRKKNGKATTDWKNEVIKRGGEEMVEFVYPVIRSFWLEERSPNQWNMGIISNIWKGKGDREIMSNQRGITVSSTIGTIAEEIIFNRISKIVHFTQAQAGGRKGGSTADHVFVLRNIITIAKKERRNIIVTFYDVVKAYDRADMDDMCYSMYKHGVTGKLWRLMKSMNENLTAKINTKAGMTREISRQTGGKQGGKLMVTMFAGTMDNMAEDMMADRDLGIDIGEAKIPAMLYMDDATTFAEGEEQQEKALLNAYEFALKHKLEWGLDKCKTMEIGSHKEKRASWRLGEKEIGKCENYKYLGEQINRNGKNDLNLKERCDKLRITARAIITCCKTEIMSRIGMKIILKLHEAETIPALLYNGETWTLNKTEKRLIDQAEIYAWKKMVGLPQTTPTGGIILTIGCLFATVRLGIKQLLYLHKILLKEDDHWTKVTLNVMKDYDIGWARQINELLESWQLEREWPQIQRKSPQEWKTEVQAAAEKINISRLAAECETTSRTETRQKTKTKFVMTSISNTDYTRRHDSFIDRHPSVLHTRALIMGRYGMLQCANNFSCGYGSKICTECNAVDNEEHRINECRKYDGTNLYNSANKITYDDIYSDDEVKCFAVVDRILSVWDLGNGKNNMRQVA